MCLLDTSGKFRNYFISGQNIHLLGAKLLWAGATRIQQGKESKSETLMTESPFRYAPPQLEMFRIHYQLWINYVNVFYSHIQICN